ncbi:MAG: hypothetical protein RL748_805, partial [Pseudomonadota bacterium]
IKQSLRQLGQDGQARALLIETFFANDEPQLAHALYSLIRDADLKDVNLLEGLIERDSRTPDSTFTARILDLIADLNGQNQERYSTTIDGYLAQMARSADAQIHLAAATRRIWYLNQYQPYNLAAQQQYLVDTTPTVRQEVYSLIESRIASQTVFGQAQLVAALNAALRADYPGASSDEKARVAALLQAIQAQGT